MKALIQKYKLLIIFVLFIIIFAVTLLIRKTPPAPVPTPFPVVFRLEQTFPLPGTYELVIPNLAIHFTFSKPFDVANTAVKIEPFMDFEISTDDANLTLFIMPVPEWEFNTEYTITISTKSKDGESLEEPVKYQFQPVPLTTSELEENIR
jgi:hypothetical protein